MGRVWPDRAWYGAFDGCVVVGYEKNLSLGENPALYVVLVRKEGEKGNFMRVGVGKVEADSIWGPGTVGIWNRCRDG